MRISLIHVRLSSISQAVVPLPQLASMHRLSLQQLGMFNDILTDMLVDGLTPVPVAAPSYGLVPSQWLHVGKNTPTTRDESNKSDLRPVLYPNGSYRRLKMSKDNLLVQSSQSEREVENWDIPNRIDRWCSRNRHLSIYPP